MNEKETEFFHSSAIVTLVVTFIFGFLAGELVPIPISLISAITAQRHSAVWIDWAFLIGAGLGWIELTFIAINYVPEPVSRIAKSKRFDIFIMAILGGILACTFPRIGYQRYSSFISGLGVEQRTALFMVLVLVIGLCLIGGFRRGQPRRENSGNPVFVSDLERSDPSGDLLNVRGLAENFAERVLNGGAPESIVFGVDAPWGAGKSTFVNFCISNWQEREDVIVYKFSPLQYEDREHLLQKFVDGLTSTIARATFAPELRMTVSRYSKILSAKRPVKFAGFEFELSSSSSTLEEASSEVARVLSDIGRQMIIVVDDLDRMAFSSLKDMLFVVKKAFSFPNVSFVLCYDTQNVAALEAAAYDNEKISEFLEKFVNVKVGLFPSSMDLKRFVGQSLKVALGRNLQADPFLLDKVLEGLRALYDDDQYYLYAPVIGDIRKIKRLINTLVLLNLEKTDFDNTNIYPRDLILLLLIYVNYPTLFRKIFSTETDGRGGYFSLESLSGEYKNSDEFKALLKQLDESQRATERWLLQQLFDAETRFNGYAQGAIPERDRHSFACFNSNSFGGRNLEAYLNLIVRVARPQPVSQYRFYENLKNRLRDGESLDRILAGPEFNFSNSERSHELLWRVISNSLEEFDAAQIGQLIRQLLRHIPDYSVLEVAGLNVGLRMSRLPLTLLKLVDIGGWQDERGRHENNTDENLIGIAHWVLGLATHEKEGVIATLAEADRGVLGFHDAMVFRLYACINRDGSLFNLYRALAVHSRGEMSGGRSTAEVVVWEMRAVSQLTFQLFRDQYISAGRNFLNEVDEIDHVRLSGKFSEYIRERLENSEIFIEDVEASAEVAKSTIKVFTIYQLTNLRISSGIGCGYYDVSGDGDKAGIFRAMNEYLFGTCFAATETNDGHKCFVKFLLAMFTSNYRSNDDAAFTASLAPEILDEEKLAEYWLRERTAILNRNFAEEPFLAITSNYRLEYKNAVPKLIEKLEELVN